MEYDEFIALSRGLRSIPKMKNPGTQIDVGMDASAFHGQHDAQVALLQSLILRAAQTTYIGKENFRVPPVDKPHTRSLRAKKFRVNSRHSRLPFVKLQLTSFTFQRKLLAMKIENGGLKMAKLKRAGTKYAARGGATRPTFAPWSPCAFALNRPKSNYIKLYQGIFFIFFQNPGAAPVENSLDQN